MQSENLQSPKNEVELRLTLLQLLDSGQLETIRCPECGQDAVSVWFTRPTESDWRTWFVCAKCDFRMRAQNSEQPKYFSVDRVDAKLQEYDAEMLQKKRFH